MVDKITSPIGANELILKVNDVIDNIPTDVSQLNNDAGYITGISSSDIETALGYVPYSASNPDGFITSAAISTLTDVALSNLANGQGLIYNSTSGKWENTTIEAGGSTWGSIQGTLSDQTDLQSALNGKQDTITGAASSITSNNLTGNRVLVSGTDGKVTVSAITTTKLGYLTDVTSNIQAQINGKQASNLVTSIDSSSTDAQYPSAKCVYDAIQASGSTVDQTYSPASTNAQSGTAVAQAVATKTQVIFRDWGAA